MWTKPHERSNLELLLRSTRAIGPSRGMRRLCSSTGQTHAAFLMRPGPAVVSGAGCLSYCWASSGSTRSTRPGRRGGGSAKQKRQAANERGKEAAHEKTRPRINTEGGPTPLHNPGVKDSREYEQRPEGSRIRPRSERIPRHFTFPAWDGARKNADDRHRNSFGNARPIFQVRKDVFKLLLVRRMTIEANLRHALYINGPKKPTAEGKIALRRTSVNHSSTVIPQEKKQKRTDETVPPARHEPRSIPPARKSQTDRTTKVDQAVHQATDEDQPQ